MQHQGVLLRQRALCGFDFQLPNYQITHLANLADPITRSSSAFLCVLCGNGFPISAMFGNLGISGNVP
jgi:hypothetical protein